MFWNLGSIGDLPK